jgi:tetratricopeptide (TPR) repeat protein
MSDDADMTGAATGVTDDDSLLPLGDEVTFKLVSGPADAAMPYLVPDLPPYFAPRAELLAIKKLLLGRPAASLAPLTLHGPSGAGKTSLALATAHDADVLKAFPDGVLWYSLGDAGDVQHAQSVWGEALGDDLSHVPDTASRAAALRTLLRDRRALLVIDDVTDVEQIRALNVGGPNCARLITTDSGEEITYAFKTRRYAITRMNEQEALTMLTQWAGILPDIYLPTVKEIIKRLTYSPLALALVGAQARQGITWLRLLEVLRDDQGPIATLTPEDPEVRKNALRLVINLVLSRFGAKQLQRSTVLGAFAAGTGAPFSVEAASAAWEMEPEETGRTLNALMEAAIVQRMPGTTYTLHRALKEHLVDAARPGVVDAAAARIADHYIDLVERSGSAGSAVETAIDAQIGQIMATYHHTTQTDPARAAAFADALISLFERRGLWANLVTLTTQMVEASHKANDVAGELVYLGDLGYSHTMLGNLDEARDCFERSLSISQRIGDPAGEAAALNNIGAILERQGSYSDARDHYERSLAIREQLGMEGDIAETLNNVAGVLYREERWDEALKVFQRALDMYSLLSDRDGQARTWLNIGASYEQLGHDEEAQQSYQRSLAIYTNEGDEAGQAQALNNLGIIYFNLGDVDRALAQFKRSLALKDKLGDRLGEASTLNNIALLYEKTGSVSLALDHYERSYQILSGLEDPRAELVQENITTLRTEMDRKK